MLLYTPLVLLSISHIVSALRNISLDDSDPAIVYHGNWLHTPYDPTNRGGHHRVTADANAYATLAFNGVAIYFYSPLWPFRVTTVLSLDGETDLLDLRDHDVPFYQDGAETTNSFIVWYIDGLENASHLLNVSVGTGEDLAILDYLVYTIRDPGDPSIAPASVSYIHTRTVSISSSSLSSASPQATFSSTSSTKIGLSVTLAVVCIVFTSIVLWAFFWWWKRRHRRRLDELSIASSHDHQSMTEATTRRPTYPRTIPSLSRMKNLPLGIPSKRAGPSSSRRPNSSSSHLAFSGMRGAKKSLTLTPIPESSGDNLDEEEEDSASQGSSTTMTTVTTSPEASVKNDNLGDPRKDSPSSPQHDSPTVRLVTDS